MKKALFVLIVLVGSSQAVFAISKASNWNYKYCDDIKTADKLLDRTRESVQRIKAEGQPIERILVSKDRKELYLISGETLFRKYTVAFGTSPRGHKQFQGDKKTPEGIYAIDGKNPNSKFHLSLGVSYPNKKDIAYARSQGKSAGGDIMVHGLPNPGPYTDLIYDFHPTNWTAGCIAVTNEEIEEIYSLVQVNTLIEICKMAELPPNVRYR
jgi:murein L,D-transpeptidase YafK